MGWTYARSITLATLIAELTEATPTFRTLAHVRVGGVLWTVHETDDDAPPDAPRRWIGCYLLDGPDMAPRRSPSGGPARPGAYGYKDQCEEMGPYSYSCPLVYLDLVPQPPGAWAARWREQVRAWHAVNDPQAEKETATA